MCIRDSYKEAFKEICVAGEDLFCFNHELNGSGGELSELKSRIKIAMDQAEAAVEKFSSPFSRAESMIQVNGQLEKNLQEQKARQVAGTVERWSYGDPIQLGGFVSLCQRNLQSFIYHDEHSKIQAALALIDFKRGTAEKAFLESFQTLNELLQYLINTFSSSASVFDYLVAEINSLSAARNNNEMLILVNLLMNLEARINKLSSVESYSATVTIDRLFDRRRLNQIIFHKFMNAYRSEFLKSVAAEEAKIKSESKDKLKPKYEFDKVLAPSTFKLSDLAFSQIFFKYLDTCKEHLEALQENLQSVRAVETMTGISTNKNRSCLLYTSPSPRD